MTDAPSPAGVPDPVAPWDWLAADLQELRHRVGDPSYAEIARRIAERRRGRGADEHAARVARSTVYDTFTPGRARINVTLADEILVALGRPAGELDRWIAARADATRPDERIRRTPPVPRPSTRSVVALLVGCLAVNMVGRVLVDSLTLPLYLDMIGTAIAALALGPWRGAAVGAATNVVGVLSSGPVSLAFVPVNVVGALVWGYGLRRWDLGRTLPRFFLLAVLTALACSAVAVPTLHLAFGGLNGNGTDVITRTVRAMTGIGLLGVLVSNVLVSLVDKLLSSFLALVGVTSLPPALRRGAHLDFVRVDAGPGTTSARERAS